MKIFLKTLLIFIIFTFLCIHCFYVMLFALKCRNYSVNCYHSTRFDFFFRIYVRDSVDIFPHVYAPVVRTTALCSAAFLHSMQSVALQAQ